MLIILSLNLASAFSLLSSTPKIGGVPVILHKVDEVIPTITTTISPYNNYMTGYLTPRFSPFGVSSDKDFSFFSHFDGEEKESVTNAELLSAFSSLNRSDFDVVSLSMGLSGMVREIPTHFTQQFILSVSSDGVSGSMERWGEILRRRSGKQVFPSDLTAENLGCWTDNGAYYYYLTLPDCDYAVTMDVVAAYHRELDLPVCICVVLCCIVLCDVFILCFFPPPSPGELLPIRFMVVLQRQKEEVERNMLIVSLWRGSHRLECSP